MLGAESAGRMGSSPSGSTTEETKMERNYSIIFLYTRECVR